MHLLSRKAAVSAAAAAADGHAGGDGNGWKHDSLKCRPSDSTIRSAYRRIRRFGVRAVKFNDLECQP